MLKDVNLNMVFFIIIKLNHTQIQPYRPIIKSVGAYKLLNQPTTSFKILII